MFPIVFQVETTGITVRQKRKIDGFVKRAMSVMLHYWFTKYFKLHFSMAAFHRYPGIYAVGKTVGRGGKQQRGQNPQPLVESGEALAMAEDSFHVQGTAKLMRAIMRLPWYVFRHAHIDPRRELSFINRPEADKMAGVFRDTLVALVNGDTETEMLTIR